MFILAPERCHFDFNDWLEITNAFDAGKLDYLTSEKINSPVTMRIYTYDVAGTVITSKTRQTWTSVETPAGMSRDGTRKVNTIHSETTFYILQECDAFRYYGRRHYAKRNNIVTEESYLINTEVYDNDRDAILTILKLMVK